MRVIQCHTLNSQFISLDWFKRYGIRIKPFKCDFNFWVLQHLTNAMSNLAKWELGKPLVVQSCDA